MKTALAVLLDLPLGGEVLIRELKRFCDWES